MPCRGRHEAVFAVADEVASACKGEGLDDLLLVFGDEILQQGALHGFFALGFGDIDRLERVGVKLRVEHRRGDGAGCGIKILHLLGMDALPLAEQRQLHRVLEGRAGVRAHQIRHHILVFVLALCQGIELVAEFFVGFDMRLAVR